MLTTILTTKLCLNVGEMRENNIYIYIMITDILDLERGKNYLVEYREPGSRTINFIGKFRPGRYWPPTDYLPDNLSFEIMYYYEFVYDIDGSFGTKWNSRCSHLSGHRYSWRYASF